eukprot:gene15056-17817_t
MGYKPGWDNVKSAGLCGKVGITSNRMSFPRSFFEKWGYSILYDNNSFKSAVEQGQSNFTAFLTWDQSNTDTLPTTLFENIWNSDNITVNPANEWALFISKAVTTYKGNVTVYEVWNEPDWVSDWQTPALWETTAPTKAQLVRFGGSIYDYVRMLRITWEVAKSIDPDCFITVGGLGYPTFLDAVLRYTDNSGTGLTGKAYIDSLSLHFYPVFATSKTTSDDYVKAYVDQHRQFK